MNGKNQLRSHRVIYLISGYISNILTAQEHAELEQWKLENAENEVLFGQLIDDRFRENELEGWKVDETEQVLRALQARQINTSVPIWRKIAVVAAIAVIVFGVWFFSAQYINGRQIGGRHPEFISGSQYDIEPGSNKATITLANGKTINLSDAKTGVVIGEELRYNDGSAVANLSPSGRDAKGREGNNSGNPLSPQGGSLPEGERSRVQTLIASTPRGGTYQVTLPDGTRVWLNADSKISFPSQFSGKERRILLSGEAYFEVAKLIRLSPGGREGRRSERVSFIVESRGQEVEVLGTHFNINSYVDEGSVKTTLLEGAVRVAFLSPPGSLSGGERSVMLKPGQQSILLSPSGRDGVVREGKITVNPANISEAMAWKDGYFRFNNEDLASIMRKLEKWYDIEVTMPESLGKKEFTGKISRNKNISRVLKMLEKTNGVHFKIEGRRVVAIE